VLGLWEPRARHAGTAVPAAASPPAAPASPPGRSGGNVLDVPPAAPPPRSGAFGLGLPDFMRRRGATRSARSGAVASEVVLPSATGAPPAEPLAAPPPLHFEAYPRLELEREVVEPGARFELLVGLAREAVAQVSGSAVTAELPGGTTEFDLDVQIVADGFEAPAGWYFRLRVPVATPESAELRVPLIAPRDQVTRLSILEVHFCQRGRPCGVAFRRIAVQPPADARPEVVARPATHAHPWVGTGTAGGMVLDPDDPPPDLWITISKPDGNQASGRYYWSFKSPHPIALPTESIPVDLGDDARTFAGRMIQLVTRAEGTPLIDQALNALGRQVHDRAPAVLDEVLHAVWGSVPRAAGRVPTILLHSAEPHVPWELARLAEPPDPALPPFLGTQFAVGRWILGARGLRVPPAREVPVRAMAVVAGDYRSSFNLRPLLKAEAEGDELARRWGAIRLKATVDEMNALLEAGLEQDGVLLGGAEAIHFACHGEVDPRQPQEATIFLDNDWPLDASLFLEAPVGRTHQPFLFLNACQVGQAGESLGDYAGFAGCCLRNGFRGFVAPLWSVSDDIAHEVALQFYDAAFAAPPTPVAEILRRIRCRYPANDRIPASTWLAYVFYGNPACMLRRAPEV
jgi:hypothetical protein